MGSISDLDGHGLARLDDERLLARSVHHLDVADPDLTSTPMGRFAVGPYDYRRLARRLSGIVHLDVSWRGPGVELAFGFRSILGVVLSLRCPRGDLGHDRRCSRLGQVLLMLGGQLFVLLLADPGQIHIHDPAR